MAVFLGVSFWRTHFERDLAHEHFGFAVPFTAWFAAHLFTVVVVKVQAAIPRERLPPDLIQPYRREPELRVCGGQCGTGGYHRRILD
jgi:hypothetical protein